MGEGAAMHRTGLLVDRFVAAHIIEKSIERFLFERNVRGQMQRIDLGHQIAEHGAFAAAGGLGALGHFFVEIFQPVACRYRHRIHFPINLHRNDFINRFEQALVAQIADHQRLGCCAQGHDGEDFALVDIDRQRMLAGDGRGFDLAAFIDGIDGEGRGPCGVRQCRAVGHYGFFADLVMRMVRPNADIASVTTKAKVLGLRVLDATRAKMIQGASSKVKPMASLIMVFLKSSIGAVFGAFLLQTPRQMAFYVNFSLMYELRRGVAPDLVRGPIYVATSWSKIGSRTKSGMTVIF